MIVNIVSAVPPQLWERELQPGLPAEFVHTQVPVQADWHVIYGLREKLKIPNSSGRVLFVASEPPEIREYSGRVLGRYAAVLALNFPYLQDLPHYLYGAGLAPWWVGGCHIPGGRALRRTQGPLDADQRSAREPAKPDE